MKAATRFVGPAAVATGPTTQYTVPAVSLAVLRHLHLSNPSASAVTFTLTIGADAAGVRLFGAYSIAAGAVFDHFCYYPVVAAEIITTSAGTNNILVMTLSGDLITLG